LRAGGEADLVVDHEMDRSAGGVARQARQAEAFRDNALAVAGLKVNAEASNGGVRLTAVGFGGGGAFDTNLDSVAPVCGAESTAGTVQSDPSCEYNMYVIWSKDGGSTWDGGGGAIPGSAGAAYRVNSTQEHGTHWFPAIAADSPGHVDVAYLRTSTILPTGPSGKADPGGCAGSKAAVTPPTYPAACQWFLYAAQSSNLTLPPGKATWTTTNITGKTPMHIGDICNLGIACIPNVSNRHLLDFIQEAIDPVTGCAHIAYADDNKVNMLRMANQTSGCFPRRHRR